VGVFSLRLVQVWSLPARIEIRAGRGTPGGLPAVAWYWEAWTPL